MPYPQCCGARSIVEFSNTDIGFGGGDVTPATLDKFLTDTLKQFVNGQNTFLTCVINNDQYPILIGTFVKHGFRVFAKDQYHPKYGNSLSFLLYVKEWGVNPKESQLVPDLADSLEIPSEE
jgi:hypothetical protein